MRRPTEKYSVYVEFAVKYVAIPGKFVISCVSCEKLVGGGSWVAVQRNSRAWIYDQMKLLRERNVDTMRYRTLRRLRNFFASYERIIDEAKKKKKKKHSTPRSHSSAVIRCVRSEKWSWATRVTISNIICNFCHRWILQFYFWTRVSICCQDRSTRLNWKWKSKRFLQQELFRRRSDICFFSFYKMSFNTLWTLKFWSAALTSLWTKIVVKRISRFVYINGRKKVTVYKPSNPRS